MSATRPLNRTPEIAAPRFRISARHWTGIAVAAAVIGIVLYPWPVPSPEVDLVRFLPHLITVDPRGTLGREGEIRVGERELIISTVPRSQPTVHLLTTDVPFTATFSVTVLGRQGGTVFPFQLKVWNPAGEWALEVWYALDGSVVAGVRVNEQWQVVRRLGTYADGHASAWRVERHDRSILVTGGRERESASFRIGGDDFPALFAQPTLSLTLYASVPAEGSSTVRIFNPRFTVPRQHRYGTTVQSSWFRPIVGVTALSGLLWAAPWILRRRRRSDRSHLRLGPLVLLTAASVLVGWWLSGIPGHPLDLRGAVTWSAIAGTEGPAAITGHSMLATEGYAHGGPPYAAVIFPYPPLLTYLFWLLGKIAPAATEQAFKMAAVIGVAAGGAGIYALLHHLGVRARLAAAAVGAYLLNPAVLFDAAVWGQTDAFVALFLLMGVAGVLLTSPPLLWIGTLLAVLTKQTGGLFAPMIILMGLAKMGVRRMTWGIVPAVIMVFLALTPAFLSGMHPSATYRPVWASVLALGTLNNRGAVDPIVSQSAFTPWAALTFFEGARGWARFAFSDVIPSRFGLPYFTLSRGVFALFVLLLILMLFRRRKDGPGVVWLLIATFGVGAAVLLTRVQPRYLYFGVMFTAAALPWLPRLGGGVILLVISGTMLTAMWGMLVYTSIWYPGLIPFFDPQRSSPHAAAAAVLGTDLGITVGSLLNTLALLVLVWAAWHGGRAQPSR